MCTTNPSCCPMEQRCAILSTFAVLMVPHVLIWRERTRRHYSTGIGPVCLSSLTLFVLRLIRTCIALFTNNLSWILFLTREWNIQTVRLGSDIRLIRHYKDVIEWYGWVAYTHLYRLSTIRYVMFIWETITF